MKFNKGIIQIDSQVHFETDGQNLKGAHAIAAQRLFSQKGIPDKRFFHVPQYNTWIELMYNQNQRQILEYARSIVENGMKPGILMIDEGWSEDYGVYDFYAVRFEDPKAMIEELHGLGFSVMLWVTPHISPDSNTFRSLRDKDGEFVIREWWNGFSCVLDLSNPKATEWFHGKLKALQEKYDIDGFKFMPAILTCIGQVTAAHGISFLWTAQRTTRNLRLNIPLMSFGLSGIWEDGL